MRNKITNIYQNTNILTNSTQLRNTITNILTNSTHMQLKPYVAHTTPKVPRENKKEDVTTTSKQ